MKPKPGSKLQRVESPESLLSFGRDRCHTLLSFAEHNGYDASLAVYAFLSQKNLPNLMYQSPTRWIDVRKQNGRLEERSLSSEEVSYDALLC